MLTISESERKSIFKIASLTTIAVNNHCSVDRFLDHPMQLPYNTEYTNLNTSFTLNYILKSCDNRELAYHIMINAIMHTLFKNFYKLQTLIHLMMT